MLLYETYRGIPTCFQNTNKAANTRTRITFIVQVHTPCSHLLSYKHSRHISTPFKHLSLYTPITSSRHHSSYRLSRCIITNLHNTSARSNNVRQGSLLHDGVRVLQSESVRCCMLSVQCLVWRVPDFRHYSRPSVGVLDTPLYRIDALNLVRLKLAPHWSAA